MEQSNLLDSCDQQGNRRADQQEERFQRPHGGQTHPLSTTGRPLEATGGLSWSLPTEWQQGYK